MKFHKALHPEVACSKDPHRPSLNSVYRDGQYLVATDSLILAAVPVEPEEGDKDNVLLPPPVFKSAWKMAPRAESQCTVILAADQAKVEDERNGASILYPYLQGTFPNWRQVVPTFGKGDEQMDIGIDVTRLVRLCAALGTEKVRLSISKPERGVLVRPMTEDGAGFGVFMPIRLMPEGEPAPFTPPGS